MHFDDNLLWKYILDGSQCEISINKRWFLEEDI